MIDKIKEIPFVNLTGQYHEIKSEIDDAIHQVFESGVFSGGSFISKFEENFARIHQAKYCIAVNNGTSALCAILSALGVGSGDEVIVPTNTCFPTPEAVRLTGAIPIFVDCESRYYNIDPAKIEPAISTRTKAIIVVHLYGQPAQLEVIKNIADKYDLHLLEDCAQAHLAVYGNKPVGNFGVAAAFSFYPTKNLGAFGEGGAVLCNDEALNKKIRMLRNHGSSRKNYHEIIGNNYRMDSIQAAILTVKLKYIKKWTMNRRLNAMLYHKDLKDIEELTLPMTYPGAKHSFHQYVILSKKRDKLRRYLQLKGISTHIHYPIPCHLQTIFRESSSGIISLPISERLSSEILSLPINESLHQEDIFYITNHIKRFFEEGA
jgi:dTDP-4-amino-4,6-dideoxygalactose transaminase